ncbi:hypothetical protein [Rhizobium sp. 21-4511-3d]
MELDHLTVDELHQRVVGDDNVQYVAEAVRCYHAKAYRACIIMSSNAVHDTLRRLVADLSEISSVAKGITKTVEELRDKNKGYETRLVDELIENKLLDRDRLNALARISTFRHQAAHPTEVNPSEADAKYILRTAVEHFLAAQLAPADMAITRLMAALGHDNFFPASDSLAVAEIVGEEFLLVEQPGWPRLIDNLVKAAENQASDNRTQAANARAFLCGLVANHPGEIIELVFKKAMERPKVFDARHYYLLQLIASNAEITRSSSDATLKRLDAALAAAIENAPAVDDRSPLHPQWFLRGLTNEFGRDEIRDAEDAFKLTIRAIVHKFWYHDVIPQSNAAGIYRPILDMIASKIDTAVDMEEDRLAALLIKGDHLFQRGINERDAYKLLVAMQTGPFKGPIRELVSSGFVKIPRLAAMARRHARHCEIADPTSTRSTAA